jgi:hypothetical protein
MPIPVTLFEAKDQLQIGRNDWDRDAEIDGFIEDAAAWVEEYTGHILVARDVTEHFDGFDKIDLRAWPVKPTAVPVITYAGPPVDPIAVPGPRMKASRRPARVLPAVGLRWPLVASSTIVTVTIRAGYEEDDAVPRNFRRAILILISAYDADREGGGLLEKAQATARRLCSSFRNRTL